MQHTDNELLSNIRKGDTKSFETVFKLYCDDLVRYAATILKNQDEAEDIVQQLFISLWTKKDALEVNTSLKSYLYKATYNSSLNKIKQQTVKEGYVEYVNYVSDGYAPSATQEMDRKETNKVIEEAINDLPEQCRLIFRMSRFEQLKYQQIADQLNLSVKTVENQMGKALKHMRVRLKDYIQVVIFYFLINH